MSELIVALDGIAPDKALQVAGDLSHLQLNGLWGFKIGHSLTFAGAEWINELKTFGKVFVDLKLMIFLIRSKMLSRGFRV